MKPSFDLLQEPWVPCIQSDGMSVELGLRDSLVQAHMLRELHGESALVTAALHCLLLAILHRVFGPAGYREWGDLWSVGKWDMARLDDYLNQWRHRFDLFHPERPFYQAPDPRVKPKSLNSLVPDVAFGNKATLFDHNTEDEGITLLPGEAARAVVTAQAFGLAGLSGLRQKFTDGTCARGALFLVLGDTFFETLMLNLVQYPDDRVLPHSIDDRPAWEMDDPFSPDRSTPLGYLDYLSWQNRRILFFPELEDGATVVRQMTMAPALRLDAAVLNPMKHYRRDEKRGPLVQRFNEERALWRDSAALFRLRDQAYRPPWSFLWLAELVDEIDFPKSRTRRYMALGMANNQARVDFFRSERMPLPLEYLQKTDLAEALGSALKMADDTARQVWGATRTLATLVLAPEADTESARKPQPQDLDALAQQWGVERRYWARLELPFRETMEALPQEGDKALLRWRETLWRTAWEALDPVLDNLEYDPRRLKATVRTRDQLVAGLAKALPSCC